jgi:hypothetical protein
MFFPSQETSFPTIYPQAFESRPFLVAKQGGGQIFHGEGGADHGNVLEHHIKVNVIAYNWHHPAFFGILYQRR